MATPAGFTHTVLIDGLCRDGKIEEANGICRKMVTNGIFPSVITYNALINGYCKDGRVVSAFELLTVMEKRACKPTVRTFNELMEGLCRVGKPYKAVQLLKRMIDNGLSPDIVSKSIVDNGRLDIALETIRAMVERGYELNDRIYSSLLRGFVLSQKGSDNSNESTFSDIALRETDPECIRKLISVVEQLNGSFLGHTVMQRAKKE